jgi:hypothetical protein
MGTSMPETMVVQVTTLDGEVLFKQELPVTGGAIEGVSLGWDAPEPGDMLPNGMRQNFHWRSPGHTRHLNIGGH